jgi:hypothetical protein
MAVERSIKRNGRGQIISYPVSFDENGTPLQQYGKLGIGAGDFTDTAKYTQYSFFNEFIDEISNEIKPKITAVKIKPNPQYQTEIDTRPPSSTSSTPASYDPFGYAGTTDGEENRVPLQDGSDDVYNWNATSQTWVFIENIPYYQ